MRKNKNTNSKSILTFNHNDKGVVLFPVLIFIVWLLTLLICGFFLDDTFEFDEAKYLATARGIIQGFDFSSRSTTVMGLVKHGFPQNTTHYPLNSLYIAIFFKLFGISLNVAYFSTWFAVLIACLFIYFTALLVTENNKKFSFFIAISFLFFPRVINYSNSVMMEVPGCALISFLSFLIFKNISKGKLNPLFLAVAGLWLYFYKSLFVGVIFGLVVLIIIFYKSQLTGLKIQEKSSVYLSLSLFLGTLFIIYFIFTKIIFLSLGPWLVFDFKQVETGTYADYDGGFFSDISGNIIVHLSAFFSRVISHYYPFLTIYPSKAEALYNITPHWFELAIYFLALFYTSIFTFCLWKKFNPIQRIFILFSTSTIVIFNLILIFFIGTSVGGLCRYNMIYVPLLTISFGIVLSVILNYCKPLISQYKRESKFLILSFIILVYLPYFYSASLVKQWNDNFYYNVAHQNTEMIKNFIKDTKPAFIYFVEGTLITWDLFPIRDIYMEASNDDIKKINSILPKPIGYLFLTPNNKLFKQNQDSILKSQPIIDNRYNFYGVDQENQVVVYKLNLGL